MLWLYKSFYRSKYIVYVFKLLAKFISSIRVQSEQMIASERFTYISYVLNSLFSLIHDMMTFDRLNTITFLSAWRCHTQRTKYQHTLQATIQLQRAIRMWIATRKARKPTTASPALGLHLDDSYTMSSSEDGERGASPSEFFTPSGRLSPEGGVGEDWQDFYTPACHTAVRGKAGSLRTETKSGSSPLLQGREVGRRFYTGYHLSIFIVL